ncbi:phage holin, LLH family [Ureibacillus chungkukjangi]|uniref:phage holin, LLH family n=1 Tax=Ureibacillus chungkukjangi TaxID=1202712 RepID=UPI002040C87E|nr:phage holin, LLH family [Ureibacillus chungkukjangi]MCM3387358.1 phage holin, LLH family [Ureibacillus chungkukjangi]
MEFFLQNWEVIIIIALLLVGIGFYIYKFFTQPSEKRKEQIKVWLLEAVLLAENTWQSKTGKVKFSFVYDKFIERYKWIAIFMPKAVFEQLVDAALEEMRHLLETNPNVAEKVLINEGEE